MTKLLGSAKALVAAAMSVVTLVIAAVVDQSISFDEAKGILAAIVAGALAFGAVWATPNKT